MNSNNPKNHSNSKNTLNTSDNDNNSNTKNTLNTSDNVNNSTTNINNTDVKTNADVKIYDINRINDIQLSKKNTYGNKNKKRKKKNIYQQIKEEYHNYLETKNENLINVNSFENLLSENEIENKDKIINKNKISKSKSASNFKVKEMKDSIRKNSSYNMVGDIILEINQDTSCTDVYQQVKKIKSSGSLSNINHQITPTNKYIPNKYIPNESNRFSYLMGDECVGLDVDEQENIIYKNNNELKNITNLNNKNSSLNNKINKKNKLPQINFNEIKDLDDKINSVADYNLIHTPFKMIGEEILNEEINGKYKSKLKANPENEQIIRKLKDIFKKLVYKEVKEKPNISQILLDTSLDEDLKVKVLRKYIKFITEDEVFSDEADKIKIEIKNLLKQKKLRVSDDYEELGKQVEYKIIPEHLKIKLEDIYYRVIGGDQPKLHNLLNNLLKLPFESKPNILDDMSKPNISKEEKVQFIKSLYAKLDADLYGLEETKDSIISWICQKINNPSQKISKYLCLCGPAGVGKTSIVHSISESLGIPYSYISLANIDEPGSLIGHGYTYEGSQYGSIANGMISNNCTNGILLFDELDKAKEKVQTTLLGIFDPLQNTKFRDAYFGEFNLNLSECLMIICLNDISNVNPILKDRLHIVNIHGYTVMDKKNIVSKYIIPKLNLQYNLNKIVIEDKVIDEIINKTKNFEGIRQIQMYITKIYELITLDEYINKYNFNGVFSIKNINLLKFPEQNTILSTLYI